MLNNAFDKTLAIEPQQQTTREALILGEILFKLEEIKKLPNIAEFKTLENELKKAQEQIQELKNTLKSNPTKLSIQKEIDSNISSEAKSLRETISCLTIELKSIQTGEDHNSFVINNYKKIINEKEEALKLKDALVISRENNIQDMKKYIDQLEHDLVSKNKEIKDLKVRLEELEDPHLTRKPEIQEQNQSLKIQIEELEYQLNKYKEELIVQNNCKSENERLEAEIDRLLAERIKSSEDYHKIKVLEEKITAQNEELRIKSVLIQDLQEKLSTGGNFDQDSILVMLKAPEWIQKLDQIENEMGNLKKDLVKAKQENKTLKLKLASKEIKKPSLQLTK